MHRLHQVTLTVPTRGRTFHDITADVARVVTDAAVTTGLCTLFVRHTSASLVVQENADPAVLRDLARWMERLAPESAEYEHRAALLPGEIFLTNKAPYLVWPSGNEKDQAYLLGVLCSLPLDWYARRFVEINLNFFILNPFPIPRPPQTSLLWQRTVAIAGRLAASEKRFAGWAKAVGVPHGKLDADETESMIHELDAVVSHLYGLNAQQIRVIFETFHEGWQYEDRLRETLKHFDSWSNRT